MSSTFVRVSVLHEDKQLDVSLPVQRPVVDILDDIISLLTTSAGAALTASAKTSAALTDTHVWVLSSPATGIIEPYLTLGDHDITDGAKLYLTSRPDAAHTPFVDDALAEVRSTIADHQWRWFAHTRAQALYLCALLVAGIIGVLSACGLVSAPDSAIPSQAAFVAPLVGLWLAVAVAVACAYIQPYSWMRWCGLTVPLAATISLYPFVHNHLLWWAAAVAFSCVVPAFLSGRHKPTRGTAGIVAASVSAAIMAAAAVGKHFGLSVVAMAAWGAWVPLLIVLIAPGAALRSTGLGTLLRHNDAGEQVDRESIRHSALRTEALSRGCVWAGTVCAAGIIVVLTGSGYWQHGTIAALLAVVMLLRTHGFADARIIAPLILLGVVGLGFSAGALRYWFEQDFIPHRGVHLWVIDPDTSWLVWLCMCAVLALGIVVLLIVRRRTPDDFEEAKLSKLLATVDIVASLAFIPVVLAAQGLFSYYWATS
ncbi:EsaB/YukD family protein [Corynebacterium felinum]|uniref:Type VII secretion integral membrane protein EccD n=1 Tax=Corynebacterium felinum TaxID=131318 RepID=A0ABU2BAF6_9CORY|nr:EsaB/YukD family protein [Corynebacterium felinum]MDF5819769.1 EsaB/YukD family protein [Corynebacterium felinum]MDR7354364.1 type VII secretion integral membrane protein EccD [Corynebacterium felinum]WJY93736.1 hypothetical protein CFELI_00395 [Corynebacterium felinum]